MATDRSRSLRARVVREAETGLELKFDAKAVDAVFAEVNQCHLPGAAVGIAIGGRPVYRKGFGLANIELPVVLAPTTRMRIASMTKHFTGLAYMLICEEGRGGLDEPIGKYLPELHPLAQRVTPRQLMGHTSGLRDVIDLGWQCGGRGQPVSSAELLSLYSQLDDVNAAPGTAWIYNNGGWLLLTAAIERITGQPLDDVLRSRIFEPVGMYDSMLRRWDTDFVPNSAALHMTTPAGGYDRSYLGMELTGDAGAVSTVDDMLRWLAHMDAPVVGTAATWRLMKAPQTLANGTSTGYGLGLVTDRYRDADIVYHDGGVMGGNSRMLKVPALGLDVVVIANRQDVQAALLANRVLDTCIAGLSPNARAADGPFATGCFQSSRTQRVVQLFARDGQQIVSIDGFDVPCMRDSDGTLRPLQRYRMLKVAVTLAGDPQQPSSVRLNDFGNLDELSELRAPKNSPHGPICGTYRSAAAAIEATISESAQGARLVMRSRFGSETFDLVCLQGRVWRAKPGNWWPPGGILSFADTADPQTFLFNTARTRGLSFQRVC